MRRDWIERPDANLIGHALTEALAAFDAAYYQSDSDSELRDNVKRTIAALDEVLRITAPGMPGADQ